MIAATVALHCSLGMDYLGVHLVVVVRCTGGIHIDLQVVRTEDLGVVVRLGRKLAGMVLVGIRHLEDQPSSLVVDELLVEASYLQMVASHLDPLVAFLDASLEASLVVASLELLLVVVEVLKYPYRMMHWKHQLRSIQKY